MTEIKSTQPLSGAAPPRSATAAADLALKLLQPMQGLLAAGESAEAEVISIKEALQNFQLTLRLTLVNGRQATLETSSPRSATAGTALIVTAASDTRLLATLQPAGKQPLSQIDLGQLPVGTLLQGKVSASQQLQQDGQTTFRVVISLLNSPLAGQKLSIDSALPLAPGSLVTATVQGSQSLSLVPLNGRLDQLMLGQQLSAQHNRQGSLMGLLSALQTPGASLPDGLRGAAERLLGLIPQLQQLGDAKALATALSSSGVFLEARLLGGQTEGLPNDLKAALLRLVAQLPGLPGSTPLVAAQASANFGQALPAFARNALGALGQTNTSQQAQAFPLPNRLLQNFDGEADLETILKLAAAAISRLQTHQLSSLAQSQTSPDGTQLTTWQLEVPMRDQRDIVPLQLKLQREQNASRDQEKPETLWRVELAFDMAPLGPLQVRAQLLQGALSSQIWAERDSTAQLIRDELDNLRQRLTAAGLTVAELACRQGTPPQGPRTSIDQRFVDERA